MDSVQATIFAVKRYALHDGPNIRTTVFLKGCPLSCFWCHNPEGINPGLQLVSNLKRCIGCGECVAACPAGALQLTAEGIQRDKGLCQECFACVPLCPALVHEATGRRVGIAELLSEISKDLAFFDQSGGGVTFSGGEPLAQPTALLALLRGCAELGIHRVVDTSGFAATATVLEVAGHTDLFLYDLKHMNDNIHRRYTGVSNQLILHNLLELSTAGAAIRVRIPLIAGLNDDLENIQATADFIADCPGIQGVDLLPYHSSAKAKYRKLCRDFPAQETTAPGRERLDAAMAILRRTREDITIGA